MTDYVDCEDAGLPLSFAEFDLIIIGGGAAGLTICTEVSSIGARIAVIESGAFEQTPAHENLNQVEATGTLIEPQVRLTREDWHGAQLPFWSAEVQQYGVRCRVLGGSTSGWAGKVAPFDEIDYEARAWIPGSGWPLGRSEMSPWIEAAARVLGLGPVLNDPSFWVAAGRPQPEELRKMPKVRSYFWQFARSRYSMTDVKRFGPDFRKEDLRNVTVFYNATVSQIHVENAGVKGVELISSLTGNNRRQIFGAHVVLSAGAIENARQLLICAGKNVPAFQRVRHMIGRCLMDHPSVSIGEFASDSLKAPADLFGFFGIQKDYQAFMYSHGLALTPDVQRDLALPNMAMFSNPKISNDDPLFALKRIVTRTSKNRWRDISLVFSSPVQVGVSVGRKLLENERVPVRIRRLIADLAVWMNANFVARNYVSKGAGRKIESLSVELISEQPPAENNRIVLSGKTDRLGLPLPEVHWEISPEHRSAILRAASILIEGFEHAGLKGFIPAQAIVENNPDGLLIRDMAHTSGTTRMGTDPASSVVDAACQVHGIRGLHVAGASVFPTSGHANPTLVILAFALRLAETLKKSIVQEKASSLAQ